MNLYFFLFLIYAFYVDGRNNYKIYVFKIGSFQRIRFQLHFLQNYQIYHSETLKNYDDIKYLKDFSQIYTLANAEN